MYAKFAQMLPATYKPLTGFGIERIWRKKKQKKNRMCLFSILPPGHIPKFFKIAKIVLSMSGNNLSNHNFHWMAGNDLHNQLIATYSSIKFLSM